MSGVVTGGWGFVWAAYGLTAIALALYTISVSRRYRAELGRMDEEP